MVSCTRNRIALVATALLCFFPDSQAQTSLPRDAGGWTVFTPSGDSRIVYVSSSGGNDSTGVAYSPGDPAIGPDPFLPASSVKSFATLEHASAQTRNGYPDWVLFKRGDEFHWVTGEHGKLVKREGRSATEPFLYAAYGAGCVRPIIKTDSSGILHYCCYDYGRFAVVGLHFYAHTRDPFSPGFVSHRGQFGFRFASFGRQITDVLIEDCWLQFYAVGIVIEASGDPARMVIRRNVISDSYGYGGHSQGLYTHNGSIMLEENVFDHNGWYTKGGDGIDTVGMATMFNHNVYSYSSDIVLRDNMFLRASSMGIKLRSDSSGHSRNVTIDNNLFVDGEIGMSMGGNTSEPYRFVNMTVTNNVLLDIGRSQPTGRTLGWYIDIGDWDAGVVSGNLLAHQANDNLLNVYGFSISNTLRDLTIRDNVVHGLINGELLKIANARDDRTGVAIEDNTFQQPFCHTLASGTGSLNGISFSRNRYFTCAEEHEWASVDGRDTTFAAWLALTGESPASVEAVAFPDTTRCVETYQVSRGAEATIEAFCAEARKQSRCTWRHEYTAAVVNNWLRAGFGMQQLAAIEATKQNRRIAQRPARRPGVRLFTLNGREIAPRANHASFGAGVLIEVSGEATRVRPDNQIMQKTLYFRGGK
jgi:hypothetical protein